MGDWGGKPDKRSIDEKPPELDEEMWEENRKIIKVIVMRWEKTFRTRKEKPEDCIDIADRRIDEKPPNPVGTEEENWS